MQVIFSSRDGDANDLRDLAVHRVRFVMRRLTRLVPRATVQLTDVNGPRGGVDKRCQVELTTDSAGTSGTFAFSMRALASLLSPIALIALAGGPMKVMPSSSTRRAKSSFSLRKPYPGCTAWAPVALHAAMILSAIRPKSLRR